jgi:FkbM family methyltransferase
MSFASYAQNYEDLRLWRALGHIERGCYLDIGAQDPVMDSVSKAFYDAGWRGAHVEPTPIYAAALRDNRPDEPVFEVAIGHPGAMTFFEFPDTGMSTGIAEIARMHSEAGFALCLREVPVVPLSKIFADFAAETIHWMKIDVEGMERDVIGTWGRSAAKPWVLIIESVHPSTHKPTEGEWLDLILARGYQEVAFDGLSRYFVADEHANLAEALAAPPNIFDDFRVTRYHFSSQRVVAECNETIGTLQETLAQAQAQLAGGEGRADELQAAAAALAEERTNSQATSAESVRLADELNAARTTIAELDLARTGLDAKLSNTERVLGACEAELAVTHADIGQKVEELRAAKMELIDTTARHKQAEARSRALRSAVLADYAEAKRSRDELQKLLDGARRPPSSSGDGAISGLDARVAALEDQNRVIAQRLEIDRAGGLTSSHEAVEAVVQVADSAESASNDLLPSLDAKHAPMTLDDLLEYHDEQFVRCSYRLLLSREVDSEGLRHYTQRLRRGGSRIQVLADLARSSEGRIINAQVPGMRAAIRRLRLRDWILLRPLGARLFGDDREGDVMTRLRAIENRLATLGLSGSIILQPGTVGTKAAISPNLAVPAPNDVAPPLHEAASTSPIVALDADRMVAAEHWPAITQNMFDRHWPHHQAQPKAAPGDSDRQVWIIVDGDPSSTVPANTVASLRALRDAAPFDVEFGSIGPKLSLGAKAFASIQDLAKTVSPDSLVMFIGITDQIDVRLPTALVLEQAWKRDFILSDQFYADNGRVAPVPFHGIDHYHLAHVDYFWSRFLLSGKALRQAADSGARTLVQVSRSVVGTLKGKNGKLLHLQYPFIGNGALDLETVRQSRHAVMQDLAANALASKPEWEASVSVVISTKDGGYLLDGLVQQLRAMPQIAEILIVSNNSSGDYTLDLLDRLSQTEGCSVFAYNQPFNFSVQCNTAVRAAKGRFILFLNDDVSLIGSSWLDRLLADVDVDRPRIAGPLMLYPNQSIQHGGMYLGHNDRAGHTFRHQKHPHDAPMYELVAPRQVSCLTGACLLMKRSLFDDLNGFDEQLATGLQDVDLSLRALYSGVELVLDPRAIIFHLESVSLIPTLADESVQRRRDREYVRFRDRWHSELRPDRWHNRNFYIEDESLRSIRIAD